MALILGFAAQDYPTALEIDPYDGDMLVYVAGANSTFWMTASTAPTDYSYVGSDYGVAHEATTEVTYVDITETTNTRVNIVDVDLSRGMVLATVLAANRQYAG